MNIRQIVVVRSDLQMSAGLLAAQVAHISAQFMLKEIGTKKELWSEIELQWGGAPVLSVLAVEIPEELDVLIKNGRDKGIMVHVWKDTIPSKTFDGQFLDVVVGASFGPDNDECLKQVTGTLPLY